MKGRDGRFWLLIAFMLAAALCCLPFLPAVIPVQWNDSGVSGRASRLLLLAFPALAAGFHLLRRARLSPGSQGGDGPLLGGGPPPLWGAAPPHRKRAETLGDHAGRQPVVAAPGRLGGGLPAALAGQRPPQGKAGEWTRRQGPRRPHRPGKLAPHLASLLAALLPAPWNGAVPLAAVLAAALLPRLYSALFKNKQYK